MCPNCGQNAPVVYRGVAAYCAACGQPRLPLTGNALHLAGQPSRVGSVIARVLGWIVLGGGLAVALGIGALAHLIFPGGVVGLAIGGPIAVVSLVVGLLLLRGGKRLGANGASAEKNAREQAIFALAAHKGGSVTALDTARALDIPVAAAEALLEAMAKEDYERVAVDVDANGTLVYRFVTPSTNTSPRLRVDPEVARSPNRAEWERLEADEAERAATGGRARANR